MYKILIHSFSSTNWNKEIRNGGVSTDCSGGSDDHKIVFGLKCTTFGCESKTTEASRIATTVPLNITQLLSSLNHFKKKINNKKTKKKKKLNIIFSIKKKKKKNYFFFFYINFIIFCKHICPRVLYKLHSSGLNYEHHWSIFCKHICPRVLYKLHSSGVNTNSSSYFQR